MKTVSAFVALALLLSCNSKPESQHANVAPPASDPPRPTLEQQKMCAEQARKDFDEDQRQYRESFGNTSSQLSDYTSHFDSQKNICYVRIDSTLTNGGVPSTAITVYDAFERRVYASYLWINSQKKKYWEVKPVECEIDPPKETKITCGSSEEFDQLVDKWFGVAK
jgi:hypothetical protein